MISRKVSSLAELGDVAQELCKMICFGSIVMLRGELGAGKTTFTSYILKEIVCSDDEFTSPTFNIVHEYYSQLKECKIFHLDLYRIKSFEELYEIGFVDMLNDGIMFVEWPEIAYPILRKLPADKLIMINLSFIDEVMRLIEISTPCKID